MKRVKVAVIIIAALAGLIGGVQLWFAISTASYAQQTKQNLLKLANDPVATKSHVAAIKAKPGESWTDGTVGITRDGYVFYYDLHESHGMDNIPDIHTYYLPDEKRFVVDHKHFCCDLGKNFQPKNKVELMKIIQGGPGIPAF